MGYTGIGEEQLKVLDKRIEKKEYTYTYYKEAFSDIKDIEMMQIQEYANPNYRLSSIKLKGKTKPLGIMLALE